MCTAMINVWLPNPVECAMINVWLPNPVECVYCVTDSIPTQLVAFLDLGAGVAPATDEVVWANDA